MSVLPLEVSSLGKRIPVAGSFTSEPPRSLSAIFVLALNAAPCPDESPLPVDQQRETSDDSLRTERIAAATSNLCTTVSIEI